MFLVWKGIEALAEGFRVPGIGERTLEEVRTLYPLVGRARYRVTKDGKTLADGEASNQITNLGYWALLMANQGPTNWIENGGTNTSNRVIATQIQSVGSSIIPQIGNASTSNTPLWYYDGTYYHIPLNPWQVLYADTDTTAPAQTVNTLPGGVLQAYAYPAAAGTGINAVTPSANLLQIGTNNCISGAGMEVSLQGQNSLLITANFKANAAATTLTIGSIGFTGGAFAQSATTTNFAVGTQVINFDNNQYAAAASPSATTLLSIASKLLPSGLTVAPAALLTINYQLSI